MSTSSAFRTLGLAVLALGVLLPAQSQARRISPFDIDVAPTLGAVDDLPAGAYHGPGTRAAGDTLCFGGVDGDGFAKPGGVWTFDGLQGWEAVDLSAQPEAYARHITGALWGADPYNDVPPPVLNGEGSAWFGVFGSEARSLCWNFGIGYGNDWCQRLVGPSFVYTGSGSVPVRWRFFNETEETYDFTRVYLELLPSHTRLPIRSYTGLIGVAADHPNSPPPGEVDNRVLTESDFQGEPQFRIVFEVTSDGTWSDEDGLYTTSYGAAGFDDVQIGANTYDFDSGLQGWTPDACPPMGTFLGIEALGNYVIEDACRCDLDGMVLEMHAGTPGNASHPYGQHILAVAPPVDILNDVEGSLPGVSPFDIHVDWDQYSEMPRANGVFYRPGALYYPYTCELTGEVGWSDRIGQSTFFFVGEDPVCTLNRASLTQTDVPVPPGAEQVRFVYELHSSCDAFGIEPEQCTGITNFTPIIDNVRVCFTRSVAAPPIAIDNGLHFQDGFAQDALNWPDVPGRADVTRNIAGFGNTPPYVLGDSLMVGGPPVTTPENAWEAHLWFRVTRTGLGAGMRYFEWRDQANAATGVDIEAGEFAFASMDSCQQGTLAFKNKFATYLKEEDWAAWGRSGPELSDGVEIIQDDVLFPGTQIEYFLTSNYLNTPSERFLLPDTTGGFFSEFEILPSWRNDGGIGRYPSLLYIDAFNRGSEAYITAALDGLGFDYDKYDYLDATSGWKAPMARGEHPSNNGCTLLQLLGYRGILLSTGTSNGSILWPEDYVLFSDWLTTTLCDGARRRQGFVANGDGVALSIASMGSSFLTKLGVDLIDNSYSEFSGNHAYCVGVEERGDLGSLYGTEHSQADYEYDAFGNWCPDKLDFDVLGAIGTGTGNRVYLDRDGMSETAYAQVLNEKIELAPGGGTYTENYRTLVDGISWHHLAAYRPEDPERCAASFETVTEATFNEIAAAMEWIYEVDYDEIVFLTEDFCFRPDAVEELPTGTPTRTELFQNSPNPFNPRTTIRFALSRTGPAELSVFDVAGRRVRTLVQGELEAGAHDVVWDGRDESGNLLSSGIYWTQLRANGRTFSKKATVLR
ncbi:MAG: FlgD immunoglobulin-like domain containing protein [Candidatus Eisenbacteria bacterium]